MIGSPARVSAILMRFLGAHIPASERKMVEAVIAQGLADHWDEVLPFLEEIRDLECREYGMQIVVRTLLAISDEPNWPPPGPSRGLGKERRERIEAIMERILAMP